MNKKLTIVDIADLLSANSGISKREAEQFVKDFFAVASEIISNGESLTLKGVGVFEQVWVDARSSVDVNTKEPIEIPGHYKLTFTPDKTMKDAVNAPFASFTTEVVEVVLPEDNAAKEVVVDKEVSLESDKEDESLIVETEKESADVAPESNEDVKLSEDIEVKEEYEVVEETQIKNEVNDDVQTETVLNIKSDEDIEKEYRRHTRNGYISGFITALLLFVLFVFIWLFFFKGDSGFSFSFSSFKLTSVNETSALADSTVQLKVVEENKLDSSVVTTKQPDNVVVEKREPVIETIERGKFLTTIAQKHYGDKIFWVYIYRENSDRIWNPRDLKAGFKVVVPDASKYGIDASNPESVRKAKELEKQILYEIE